MLRRGDAVRVGVAGIEAALEAAADVLARGEQGVIAGAARRELHDPHRFVPVTVTACIRGSLVEGPQAFAFATQP